MLIYSILSEESMLYALIIISGISHIHSPTQFYVYKDLEECLTQKEREVKAQRDAHCVRLEEPATIIQDLKP